MTSLRPMLLALLVVLGACEGGAGMSRGEAIGTLGGAAAGGLVGSQFGSGQGRLLATIAGTLAGGYLGNRLGARFGAEDRAIAAEAERQALSGAGPTEWRNPQSGNSGQVTPMRSYSDPRGRFCREFEHTIIVEGRRESGVGVACRNEAGEWELVES